MSTRRIKLVVEYDGNDFRGWAAQTGQRTVQGTLTEAVRRVSGEDCEIVGASRTDSGAHAEGQVCHFDTGVYIAPERWARALNRVLPKDLKVRESKRVHPEFHSRFWAKDRFYRYSFYGGPQKPRRERYAHHLGRPVKLNAMRDAGNRLIGERDFRAFTEELDPAIENSVRTLFKATVWKEGELIHFDVVGTAFLRGMMRRMAGAILEVGIGRRPASDIDVLLDPERRDRLTWPVVLPAHGLTLMRVRYGTHPKDARERNAELLEG